MGSDRYKQIPIRVTEETKQRWETEIVENPNVPHNTMAGAIRAAMEATYFTDQQDNPEVEVDLGPLESKLEETLSRMERLQEQMEQVERRSADIRPIEIAPHLRNLIQKVRSPDELPSLTRAAGTADDAERVASMGTASGYADYFEIDKEIIESALEMLEADEEIHHTEEHGQKRYYRLDESAPASEANDE